MIEIGAIGATVQKQVAMTRGTPITRGYRTLLAAAAVFVAGILVGQDSERPETVPIVAASPMSDQAPAAAALPTDAPVANLIALRAMDVGDQALFLAKMTDPQLIALQTVSVTTPTVLPQANDEALSRGLPEVIPGGTDSFGAVTAIPIDPDRGMAGPDPDLTSPQDPWPQLSVPCEDCEIVAV
ncbi:MAG TPA: hypothetical protein VIQ30_02875 [Pseudonocardia sp.]|jgi:hypothetical protein